ncbi:unnamed protein product [Didymodactylos carnosus]|uniref:NAD(P)(+)--arginine ADP-ribosyltransferase n=2 Tax=Didymodactylos carnosus TaxID=1234261 RepID=A0A8S2HZP2_9BILA|nr:unnamed protein product [Didymodactylos carnosus]CAF3677121.1 unnamed protein product [Didymodactylos carnosus]
MAEKYFDDIDVTKCQRFFDIEKQQPRTTPEHLIPIEGYQHLPLVSVEKAVETLEMLVPDIQRRAYFAKQYCDGLSSSTLGPLTTDEAAAIYLYTTEWHHSLYVALNQILRSKQRSRLLEPWLLYLKLILTALFKLKSENKTVWRGIKLNLSEQYEDNQLYTWWGFSSCTHSVNILKSEQFLGKVGMRTLFNIQCISGKVIKPYSQFQTEDEILLLPATQFQVIGKLNPAPNLHIIQLQEIEGKYPLLESPFATTTIPSPPPMPPALINQIKNGPSDDSSDDSSEYENILNEPYATNRDQPTKQNISSNNYSSEPTLYVRQQQLPSSPVQNSARYQNTNNRVFYAGDLKNVPNVQLSRNDNRQPPPHLKDLSTYNEHLNHQYNYDLPKQRKTLLHRLFHTDYSCYDQIDELTKKFDSLKHPYTTYRLLRSLKYFGKFKSNEIRMLILFGYAAFFGILEEPYFSHFMKLVTIAHLAESRHLTQENIRYVDTLVKLYVTEFESLYGERNLVSNVHSLKCEPAGTINI